MSAAEHPILMCGAMVRATLDSEHPKTHTRRVVKPQPRVVHGCYGDGSISTNLLFRRGDQRIHCPYGRPGDRLWVKETFAYSVGSDRNGKDDGTRIPYYRAEWDDRTMGRIRWRPSIFMPRWASRITLEVVSVRVERVQEISGADVFAEGVDNGSSNPAMGKRWEAMQRMAFAELWDSINSKRGYSWASNPWVWVVTFKRRTP